MDLNIRKLNGEEKNLIELQSSIFFFLNCKLPIFNLKLSHRDGRYTAIYLAFSTNKITRLNPQ